MFPLIKGSLINFISSLIYPLLLLPIFFFPENMRYEKAMYMALLSILSLLSALTLYKRIRLIEDTSSTTLNSAAQGYAVLKGTASLYDNEVTRSAHPDLPPMLWHRIWYKYRVFASWSGFIVYDDKGRCTLDAVGAEVITPTYLYNHKLYNAIYPNETLYIIGHLETLKKHRNDYERNALISNKLLEWKRNTHQFLDYFDRNRDGKIDETEMLSAKQAATRTVDMELEEIYQQPATHIVSKPDDGRPFIVSSIPPEKLLTRYKRSIVYHLSSWLLLSLFALAMQAS